MNMEKEPNPFLRDSEPRDSRDIEPRYKIVGAGLTPEILAQTNQEIVAIREKASLPQEGEKEKNKRELIAIDLANKLLRQLMDELDVERPATLKPEQVHVLETSTYMQKTKSDTSMACAALIENSIYIKDKLIVDDYTEQDLDSVAESQMESRFQDEEMAAYQEADEAYFEDYGDLPPFSIYTYGVPKYEDLDEEEKRYVDYVNEYIDNYKQDLLDQAKEDCLADQNQVEIFEEYVHLSKFFHEYVHLAGWQHYQYDDKEKDTFFMRTGYEHQEPFKGIKEEVDEKGHDIHPLLFQSLNEAVVQKITLEMLGGSNSQKIKEELGLEISSQDMWHTLPKVSYPDDIELLDAIIQRVAEFNKVSDAEIWTKIKKGYFTGQMLHLRDIERVIGSGALRLYSTIQADNSAMISRMFLYLKLEDENKRELVAREIFREGKHRDFMRYQREQYLKRHNKVF